MLPEERRLCRLHSHGDAGTCTTASHGEGLLQLVVGELGGLVAAAGIDGHVEDGQRSYLG